MKRAYRIIADVLIAALLLTGCLQKTDKPQEPMTSPKTAIETSQMRDPEVVSIKTFADPSVDTADRADPYAQLSKYTIEVYKPNRALYNALFHAVDERSSSVDLSSFDLPYHEKYATAECLYSETGFFFYYLNRFKMSKDGKTITFVYYEDDAQEIARQKETMAARLSHLLYNVAPENYSNLQKFMAVYQYVCEISSYSNDMTDARTHSPYSILVNGQGICYGYAILMADALTKLGIEAEYVCNETHAWNIVKLDGKWYNTDVTWGAGGSGNLYNNLYTILMDDETRHNSLISQGIATEGIILGFPRVDAAAPPICADTSFAAYNSIGWDYAFDIEHHKVYFGAENGIERMNLDGSGRETVQEGVACFQLIFFNGALYYISASDGFLYRLVPGQKSELLDDSAMLLYIKLEGAELFYSTNATGIGAKSIHLLRPDETQNAIALPGASMPRSRSFGIEIQFSMSMEAEQNWNELVYLVDDAGNPVPLHYSLNADGKTLMIRPKSCIADFPHVTVYVTSAVTAQNDKKLMKCYGMQVDIAAAQ